METMSVAWGYLFFILALQTVRRRSVAMLPHVLVSAAFPVASLVFDLNDLSARNEGVFTAGFVGILLFQLALIYRANTLWAIEHTLRHDSHIPAGIRGRERLKMLLTGVVLFWAHNQYGHGSATPYAVLDRTLFWLLMTLVALSVLHEFATRHSATPPH